MPSVPNSGGLTSLGIVDIPTTTSPVSILKNFPAVDTLVERVTVKWSGKASSVLIQADPDNTGNIFVGSAVGMDIGTKTGLTDIIAVLTPGASLVLGSNESMNLINLFDLFLDTATNGNNAYVSFITL